jgi:hypothetical protein
MLYPLAKMVLPFTIMLKVDGSGQIIVFFPDSFKCPTANSRFVEFVMQLHMMTTKTAHRTLA